MSGEAGFRILMIVALAGSGAVVLATIARGVASLRARQRAREAAPEQPWLWRVDWAAGRADAERPAAALALFGALWLLLTAPVLGVIPGEVARGNALAHWGWLFPGAGLCVLLAAAREHWRSRRFGPTSLELETLPGLVGGELRGGVQTRVPAEARDGFRIRLTCLERKQERTGGKRRTFTHLRWQDERRGARAAPGPRGAAIPVAFTIPWSCTPTTPGQPASRIFWQLEVRAELAGIDYLARFEVPVFRTADSSPEVDEKAADRAAAGDRAPTSVQIGQGPAPLLDGSRVRARREGDLLELHFPAPRSIAAGIALGVFGAALGWGAFWMLQMSAWLGPMALIFGGPGAVLVALGLDFWFGSVRLRVREGRLEREKRFLLYRGVRTWNADEVRGFSRKITGQTGSDPIWALRLERSGRRALTLVDGLRDRRQVDAVLDALRQVFETD